MGTGELKIAPQNEGGGRVQVLSPPCDFKRTHNNE